MREVAQEPIGLAADGRMQSDGVKGEAESHTTQGPTAVTAREASPRPRSDGPLGLGALSTGPFSLALPRAVGSGPFGAGRKARCRRSGEYGVRSILSGTCDCISCTLRGCGPAQPPARVLGDDFSPTPYSVLRTSYFVPAVPGPHERSCAGAASWRPVGPRLPGGTLQRWAFWAFEVPKSRPAGGTY